jgi:hypothetical protein
VTSSNIMAVENAANRRATKDISFLPMKLTNVSGNLYKVP